MRRSFIPRRLRHVPVLWWLAALAVAALVGTTVTQSLSKSAAAAAQFDGMIDVPVAKRQLDVGHEVNRSDVEMQQRPRAFLSDAEVAADPVGTIVSVPIDEGEVLTTTKLGSAGLSPVIALLRSGEQGVAIPRGAALPDLHAGDLVNVLATFSVNGAADATQRVSAGARVLDESDDAITLAIPDADAEKVAFAAAKGAVTLSLTLPRPTVDAAEPGGSSR